MKKIVTWVLIFCMILTSISALPVSAMAGESDGQKYVLESAAGNQDQSKISRETDEKRESQREIERGSSEDTGSQTQIESEWSVDSEIQNDLIGETEIETEVIQESEILRESEILQESEIDRKGTKTEVKDMLETESEEQHTEETSVKKNADGITKVACVGDSITYGDKSTNQAKYSYPSQMKQMLGEGYEVRNYGISGTTMTQSSWCPKYLDTQQSKDLQNWQPDIIIIMLGTNDSQDICWINTDGKGKYEPTARELIQTYQQLPSRPEIFIATCPTAGAENQFLLKPEVIDNEIVPIQKKLASELDCHLIDVNDFTKDYQKNGLITTEHNGKPDLVHPNNDGYLRLAKFMFNGLTEVTGLPQQDVKSYEIDSQNAKVKYEGSWGDWSDDELFMGTEKYVETPGSSALLEFEGTGIQVTGIRSDHLTYMDVYVDGTYYQSTDTYIPTGVKKHEALFGVDNLPEGKHTIKLVLSDKKESHHRFTTKISLDSFRIFQEPQGYVDQIKLYSETDEFIMSGMNDTLQIYTEVLPESAANKDLQFRIIPEGAATISESGVLTSKITDGSFWLTVVAADESLRSIKQEIQVKPDREGEDSYKFVDDRDPSIQYKGTWTDKKDDASYCSTLKETHETGSTVELQFQGTGISVAGQLNRLGNYSYAEVEIDGTYRGAATFMHNKDDLGAVAKEIVFEIRDLKPGSHTIKLTVKNNAPGAPCTGSCGIVLDGFKIYDDENMLDKSQFNGILENAKIALRNVKTGEEPGCYPADAVEKLRTSVNHAENEIKNAETQDEITGLAQQLNLDLEEFYQSVIGDNIKRSVNIAQPEHGSIQVLDAASMKPAGFQVENGSRIIIRLKPEENYQVDYLKIGKIKKNYSSQSEIEYTTTVNSDLEISAKFSYIKIKIACIGDSITYGACSTAPQKNSYSARLQERLGDKYDVRNFAMPSACLRYDGGFPYVNQSVYRKSLNFEPDMVIIMLGTNDAMAPNWGNGYGVDHFKADARKLINSYRDLKSNPDIYLATAPYTYDMGRQTIIYEEIAPAHREIAAKEGCTLIDMNQKTYELSKSFFYGDYIHFNDSGYNLMSQMVLEDLDVPNEYQTVDKSGLYNLYYRNQEIQEAECTAETWKEFSDTRKEAGMMLDDKNVKQSQLTMMEQKYKDAVSQLQFKKKIKVACVGDSITYGHNANPINVYSYPAQLQGLLGNQYDVQNFGVNGRTMNNVVGARYIATNEYQNSLKFNPDIVIIMLGTNDSKHNNWQGADTYLSSARSLVESYQSLGSKPAVYIATSPAVAKDMSSSTDPENEKIWDWRIQEDIVPLQKQVAEEFNCSLIDNNAKTEALEDISVYLSNDLIHPHNAGYTLLASYMYEGMKGSVPAFKEDLRKAAEDAKNIDTDKYIPKTTAFLNQALSDAEQLLADNGLTVNEQNKIMRAIDNLNRAIDSLLLKADKTALSLSVKTAQGINYNIYTKLTADQAAVALERAKKVIEDANISVNDQKTVDDAKNNLDTAVGGLLKKADTAQLVTLIQKIEGADLSSYTEASVSILKTALNNSKKMCADMNLSIHDQRKVNDMQIALQKAFDQLVKKPVPEIKVNKITVKPSKASLSVGKSLKVKTTVSPSNVNNKKLKWSTSNRKIATVSSSGRVSAKKVGKVKITVQAVDGSKKKAVLNVTVVPKTLSAPKVKKKDSHSVTVSWKKGRDVTGYEVRMSTKKNTGFVKKGIVKKNTTKLTVKNLKKGKTYYFRVRALKKIGKSTYKGDWSKTVKFKMPLK